MFDVSETTNDEGEPIDAGDILAQLSRFAHHSAAQEDKIYLDQMLKVINDLPPDQRRAFILRRILGFKEEAVAEKCGVTDRTIRYRVTRADQQLKKFKEDL